LSRLSRSPCSRFLSEPCQELRSDGEHRRQQHLGAARLQRIRGDPAKSRYDANARDDRGRARRSRQIVPGQTRTSLAKKVSASVAENANIINIKVSYGSAEGAAALAGAVAQAFLNQHAAIEHSQTASASPP